MHARKRFSAEYLGNPHPRRRPISYGLACGVILLYFLWCGTVGLYSRITGVFPLCTHWEPIADVQ
jgi:hypothetical protein